MAFVAAIGWMSWDYIAAEWYARDAEREIIALANRIPDNASREQVAESVAQGNYRHLTLRPHFTDDEWFFLTPPRVGASEWTLVVAFDRGHVVAVRVRTADSLDRRPDGAPPDRTLR